MSNPIAHSPVPAYLLESRTVGWVELDVAGCVLMANDFFKRLVGERDVTGMDWQRWFDKSERTRDLPEAHRILAHAEGEYRTRSQWRLPPHFSVELELIYSAVDSGNGHLHGNLIVMVMPARGSGVEDQLRRLVEAGNFVKANAIGDITNAALEPLKDAQKSLSSLQNNWNRLDKQERAAEVTSLIEAVGCCRKILEKAAADALAKRDIPVDKDRLAQIFTARMDSPGKSPYQCLIDRMVSLDPSRKGS